MNGSHRRLSEKALPGSRFLSSATVLPVRRDSDFFGDVELPLLYLARALRDALKLEDLLAAGGVDYLVETGMYTSGFLIRRELTGAYFYISPTDEARARDLLLANGFKPQPPAS
jgi:hypothetical protein